MSLIKLMHAKLHRVRVTDAKRDYVGSITIDAHLLDTVGLMPLEEVEIVNIDNGKRWSTYVLPGAPGSGVVCPNGGGALMCTQGDILILWANAQRHRDEVLKSGHEACVVVADEHNHIKETLTQTLVPSQDGVEFSSRSQVAQGGLSSYHEKSHIDVNSLQ